MLSLIAKYGDVSIELDAPPVDVLRTRIVAEVNKKLQEKIRGNAPYDHFDRFSWSRDPADR